MPRLEAEKVVKRSESAWKDKALWRDLKQSAYELALPMRNPYHSTGSNASGGKGKQQPGARKMNRVFDSTLMISTARFANRLQTELTPPFRRWGKLTPGTFIAPQFRQEVQKQLDRLTEALFGAIFVSNFDTAINEFFLDLAVGTGVMMVMEGDDRMPIRYVCVPQAQVALEEGAWGGINGVFRKHSMKIRLIEQTWDGFDLNLPDGFEKMNSDDPEKEIDLIEATYYDQKDDVWRYDVIWAGPSSRRSKTKQVHRLVEEDFEESPWIVTRWIKLAGEVEGRGPVLFALPDAKTLNKLKELVLMNASIAVSGVWTAVDDGVLNPNTVRIIPGAVIPVARNGGALGASLQPLETGARFDVASLVADDLTQSIKSIMMDGSLPSEEGPVRSATEFVARIKELQQDIGSPFGRLMTELLRPLVQKSLGVLSRKGIVPQQGIRVDGGTVDVQLQSPLAQAQNLSDVEAAIQWITLVKGLGEEAFLLGVSVEDTPAWLGEKMGVDGKLMRTEDQRRDAQKMIGTMLAQRGGTVPAGQAANDQGGLIAAAA